jgi:prolycopene isomerase
VIERADVVVAGAGLGGLSAAAHLAAAGNDVLVLEHHDVPGGYAHEFTRKGYRFEVALHALDGAGPGGWLHGLLTDLGLLDRVELRRLDPLYTARFPGREVTAHADLADYRAELVRHFPGLETSIDSLIAAIDRVGADVTALQQRRAAGERTGALEIAAEYPAMAEAFTRSCGDFMDAHVADPELRAVFSTLWGYFGLPPSRLHAGTFALGWWSYHHNGGWYPIGGSQALSRALEAKILEHGGRIRYRQTITGAETTDGRVVALLTERGLRAEGRAFVSNASPRETLGWIGPDVLADDDRAALTDDVPALSNLVVYLGVDRDPVADGWDHHEFFLSEGYDSEADYAAAAAGDFAATGMVITDYTRSDPGCAPPGKSVLVLMTLAPWDHEDVWGTGGDLEGYRRNPVYRRVKQEAGAILIDRAAGVIPGLRDAVEVLEVATPLTNVRYARNPAGSIYGREQTVENMFAGRRSPRTPIPNLVLCGAWISGGGMSTAMQSGKAAARAVERALRG